MKISHLAGSRSWQSASLPGSEAPSSAPLRRVSSRALRAASRAAAASTTLPTTVLASAGCCSNQAPSWSMMAPSTMGRTSDDTSLSLVWDENFGSGTLTDKHAGQAFAAIVAGQRHLVLLGRRHVLGIFGHHAGQAGAEAGDMGAAVALGDVVGEGQRALVIAVVPGHGDFHRDAVLFRQDHHGGGDQRLLGAVEIFHKGLQARLRNAEGFPWARRRACRPG